MYSAEDVAPRGAISAAVTGHVTELIVKKVSTPNMMAVGA